MSEPWELDENAELMDDDSADGPNLEERLESYKSSIFE